MAKLISVEDVANVMKDVKKEAQEGLIEAVGIDAPGVVARFATILCATRRVEVMVEQLETDILTRAAIESDEQETTEEKTPRRKPRKKTSKKNG